jgi:hypothetical protein
MCVWRFIKLNTEETETGATVMKRLQQPNYRQCFLVLCGFDTWSITSKKNIGWGFLKAGCSGEYLDLTESKRILYKTANEESFGMPSSPNINLIMSRNIKLKNHVACL